MDTRYKVVTDGKLRGGVAPAQFVKAFSQTFKVPEAQAQQLLTSGRTVVLKDNLDQETAEKFRRVLVEQIGLEVRVEAKTDLGLAPDGAKVAQEQAGASATMGAGVRCPKCGSDRVEGDDCLACGVIISRYRVRQEQSNDDASSYYAPPASNVVPDKREPSDEEFEVRKVGVGQGWQWIVGGWQIFVGNPGAWIGALVVWYLIMMVAGFIPFIGSTAMNILSPVFVGGLMLGAREQRTGGDFKFDHLFAGFSAAFGNLALVGLLYLVGSVITLVVVGALFFLTGLGPLMHQSATNAADVAPAVASIMLLVFVGLLLFALLGMAFYFVPLLVVFDGYNPIEATKLSFTACWKNAITFLVYGLIAFGLGLVAIIPLGLGLLVLMPVLIASVYVSYRDIFYGSD